MKRNSIWAAAVLASVVGIASGCAAVPDEKTGNESPRSTSPGDGLVDGPEGIRLPKDLPLIYNTLNMTRSAIVYLTDGPSPAQGGGPGEYRAVSLGLAGGEPSTLPIETSSPDSTVVSFIVVEDRAGEHQMLWAESWPASTQSQLEWAVWAAPLDGGGAQIIDQSARPVGRGAAPAEFSSSKGRVSWTVGAPGEQEVKSWSADGGAVQTVFRSEADYASPMTQDDVVYVREISDRGADGMEHWTTAVTVPSMEVRGRWESAGPVKWADGDRLFFLELRPEGGSTGLYSRSAEEGASSAIKLRPEPGVADAGGWYLYTVFDIGAGHLLTTETSGTFLVNVATGTSYPLVGEPLTGAFGTDFEGSGAYFVEDSAGGQEIRVFSTTGVSGPVAASDLAVSPEPLGGGGFATTCEDCAILFAPKLHPAVPVKVHQPRGKSYILKTNGLGSIEVPAGMYRLSAGTRAGKPVQFPEGTLRSFTAGDSFQIEMVVVDAGGTVPVPR